MQKTKLNVNPVGANCVRPHFEEMTKNNQKGITLIALIITIIVMLILVGVTINVALNGGLFTKAEQATQQMEASMVKEQFEIAKAVAIADNGGNPLNDYSVITVDDLDLNENTKNKYKDKILVNIAGDICYNPDIVTDTEERAWLEEIGINEYKTTQTLGFYGISYTVEDEFVADFYFFGNNIAIMKMEGTWIGFKYTKNENLISMEYRDAEGTLSDDYKTITIDDGATLNRDENNLFSYEPIQNETYKIYSNALYISSETGTIIATPNESILIYDGLQCSFADMETNGVTVLDDTGKTMSYNNETFTLVEILE